MSDLDDDILAAYDELDDSLTAYVKEGTGRFMCIVFLEEEEGTAVTIDVQVHDDVVSARTRIYQNGDLHGDDTQFASR